jgi:hypothetical protein
VGVLSVPGVGVLAVAVAALVAFAWSSGGRPRPVIPPWVFRSRLLNTTNLASLSIGVVLIGLTSYVPLYVQALLGQNALVAASRSPRSPSAGRSPASSAGRIYLTIGFRLTALLAASSSWPG